MEILVITSLFLLVLGGGLLFGGLYGGYRQRQGWGERQTTQGRVIDLRYQPYSGSSGGLYCPVIRYTTRTGEEIEFVSQHGNRPAAHKVGQTVTVRYDAFNPENAEIDAALQRWLAPAVMTALGAVVLFLGGAGFFLAVVLRIFGADF